MEEIIAAGLILSAYFDKRGRRALGRKLGWHATYLLAAHIETHGGSALLADLIGGGTAPSLLPPSEKPARNKDNKDNDNKHSKYEHEEND